ncbi:UNVERIFIED_CONTAM: hypothetical protein Scaly_0279800 [Sesamum calycinum]|uniref:Uncharacterized protein n=1 Tax=Sesamum calycinum TaxID=2727403 RepID=A0AAW2SAZ6_9LAMI
MSVLVEGNDSELERGDWQFDDLEEDNLGESADNAEQVERGEVVEPYVGMEFDSEDDAKRFYNDYARKGVSPSQGKVGQEKKPQPNAREGCKATILLSLRSLESNMLEDGALGQLKLQELRLKNVSILLSVQGVVCMLQDLKGRNKDKKIQELAKELQRQEELAAAYRERLVNLLANIEDKSDHLSSKVLAVVQNVRKAEAEALSMSKA